MCFDFLWDLAKSLDFNIFVTIFGENCKLAMLQINTFLPLFYRLFLNEKVGVYYTQMMKNLMFST